LLQELQTALHIAARQGDVDGVELLLQRGAAPNSVTSDLNTPLHAAAREGHDNVANALIAHAANMALANKVSVYHLIYYAEYDMLNDLHWKTRSCKLPV